MIFSNEDFAMLSDYLAKVYYSKNGSEISFEEFCKSLRVITEKATEDSSFNELRNLYGQFYINKKTLKRTFDETIAKIWEDNKQCRTINFLSETKHWDIKSATIQIARKLDYALTRHIHWIQAFSMNKGVQTNAIIHAKNDPQYAINIDLSDAFHQISSKNVKDFATKVLGFNRKLAWKFANITTCNGRLVQGSPLSPVLMNIFALKLDFRLNGIARKIGMTYTRYADDITLSGKSYIKNYTKNYLIKIITDSNWNVNPKKVKMMKNILQFTGINYNFMTKRLISRKKTLKMDLRALEHKLKIGEKVVQSRKTGEYIDIEFITKGIYAWLYPNFGKIAEKRREGISEIINRDKTTYSNKKWGKRKQKAKEIRDKRYLNHLNDIISHKVYYEQLDFELYFRRKYNIPFNSENKLDVEYV
jgi:hypothetical protein